MLSCAYANVYYNYIIHIYTQYNIWYLSFPKICIYIHCGLCQYYVGSLCCSMLQPWGLIDRWYLRLRSAILWSDLEAYQNIISRYRKAQSHYTKYILHAYSSYSMYIYIYIYINSYRTYYFIMHLLLYDINTVQYIIYECLIFFCPKREPSQIVGVEWLKVIP